MLARCSAKQLAEAVFIFSSFQSHEPVINYEFEEIEDLKCLDIFLSTLVVFSHGFSNDMKQTYGEFMEQPYLSKELFIEYLKPRALLLTEKNGYFDLMLLCTYFYLIVRYRTFSHNCFHLARVACKLLTRILEERFKEIFLTDSGWENFISYCRNIHAAVYPSKENRPPGYVPYPKFIRDKDKIKEKLNNREKAILSEESEDNKVTQQKRIERSDKFIAELLGLLSENEDSSDASSLEDNSPSLKDDSSESESIIEDATYWIYLNMDRGAIRERITHSEAHLTDVYNLLKSLKENMDVKCISSNEYDIPVSDDEYIEQLKKNYHDSTFVEKDEIVVPDSMRKFYAIKISKDENKRLGTTSLKDQVQPENITDDQIREYIFNEQDKDEPRCELCDGKLCAFKECWSKRFHEKYSNSTVVTDVIDFSVHQ